MLTLMVALLQMKWFYLAFPQGLPSMEVDLPKGSIASVGLRYEDVIPLCPPDINAACHNSSESSTISGPAETVKKLVADLRVCNISRYRHSQIVSQVKTEIFITQDKGVFSKEVACSNIAYHTGYIAPVDTILKEYLQKLIPNPRRRSVR